ANLGPGFDCLGIALNLYNHISLEENPGQSLRVTASGSCATAEIPLGETNLVYKAVKRIFDNCGRDAANLNLHLELESPLARGLGSSASAIAGGMFAANEFLGNPLSMDELAIESTSMEGHPDNVVPCLVGGLTASIVVNDKVLYRRTA